MQHLAIVLE